MENHILIGLGGVGGRVLKEFKKRLFLEFTPEERAQLPIGFLYVDASNEMMQPGDKSWLVHGENAQFNGNEFLFLNGIGISLIHARSPSFPGLRTVLGDNPEETFEAIGNIGCSSGGIRRAGRLLFGINIWNYKNWLQYQYSRCCEKSGSSRCCIYIFSGLSGGTGSGAIVDAIAQIRTLPIFNNHETTRIVVFAMAPTEIHTDNLHAMQRQYANTYAALMELNGLLTGRWHPSDVSGMSPGVDLSWCQRIISNLVLVTDRNENGNTLDYYRDLPQYLSDFVFSVIFLPREEKTFEFFRAFDIECLETYILEYWEKARNGNLIPYRTKRTSTIGIRRLVLPATEDKILDDLAQRYPSDADIRRLAKEILSGPGVMARFNSEEAGRSIWNNLQTCVGKNTLRRFVQVILPQTSVVNNRDGFAKKLETVLSDEAPADQRIIVSYSDRDNQEITVLYLTSVFPFRCLESLPLYKEYYDRLTTGDSKDTKQNRIILHGEDFAEALPSLFASHVKSREQLEAEYMPYVLLAGAMGLIRFGDLLDGTGRKAWGLTEVDEDLGLETIKPLADTFTGICASKAFTECFCEDLEAAVKNELKNKYATRMEELIPALLQLLNDTILPETGGNSASRLFISYIGHSRTAKDLLKQQE